MYRILLVDDEPIVRLGFKSLMKWEEHGILISHEASNGRQALDILKNDKSIDLVITDINMPIMDGLELIDHIKAMVKGPQIIVLSAYDDYDLVRKAFKKDIHDYILKYKMNGPDILNLLKKTLKNSKKSYTNAEEVHLHRSKKNYLRNLILGNQEINKEIENLSLNIDLKTGSSVITAITIDDNHKLKSQYTDGNLRTLITNIKNTIEQVLTEFGNGEVIVLSSGAFIVINTFDSHSEMTNRNQMVYLLNKIRHYLTSYLDVSITAGVSSLTANSTDLHALYKSAMDHVNLKYYFGKGKNIFLNDRLSMVQKPHENTIKKSNEMINAIESLNKEKSFELLDKTLKTIACFKANKLDDLLGSYNNIIILLNNYLVENSIDVSAFIGENISSLSILEQFETIEEINLWIKDYTEKVFYAIKDRKTQSINPIIRRAKLFINNHYMEKLSLEYMANHLDVNITYFSTLFSQEMDMTYSSYVTKIRMEKAKSLLHESNKKIYEISEIVGYTSAEHFTRVFKKYTGSSPLQYRQTL